MTTIEVLLYVLANELCFFSDLVKSGEEPIDRFMSNKVTEWAMDSLNGVGKFVRFGLRPENRSLDAVQSAAVTKSCGPSFTSEILRVRLQI